jgi:acyl-CoA thioesterase
MSSSPIALEKLDVDLYRSVSLWRPVGARAVFGGQVSSTLLHVQNYDSTCNRLWAKL